MNNEESKEALYRMAGVLQYALAHEGMEITLACGWDGDTKAEATITRELAIWLLCWCQAQSEYQAVA